MNRKTYLKYYKQEDNKEKRRKKSVEAAKLFRKEFNIKSDIIIVNKNN